MQKHGFVISFRHLKTLAELADIVPVYRADIMKSEILEPRIGIYQALNCAFCFKRCVRKLVSHHGNTVQNSLRARLHTVIFRLCPDNRKIARH